MPSYALGMMMMVDERFYWNFYVARGSCVGICICMRNTWHTKNMHNSSQCEYRKNRRHCVVVSVTKSFLVSVKFWFSNLAQTTKWLKNENHILRIFQRSTLQLQLPFSQWGMETFIIYSLISLLVLVCHTFFKFTVWAVFLAVDKSKSDESANRIFIIRTLQKKDVICIIKQAKIVNKERTARRRKDQSQNKWE